MNGEFALSDRRPSFRTVHRRAGSHQRRDGTLVEPAAGEDLRVAATAVKLIGIDVPEREQRCSKAGRSWRCAASARSRTRARSGLAMPVAGVRPPLELPISAAEYIELVDWTGRQLRPGKRGAIAADAPAALGRLATSGAAWTAHVLGVRSKYWRAVGATQALIDRAAVLGQRWLKGLRFAQRLETI